MANTAVVEETVKAVETTATNAVEPVKETTKRLPKGSKEALIIGGSALAIVGGYFVVKKVIVPKFNKKPHHNKKRYEKAENKPEGEEPIEVEVVKVNPNTDEETVQEPKAKPNKKK